MTHRPNNSFQPNPLRGSAVSGIRHRMKQAFALSAVLIAGCNAVSEPAVPIRSGEYTFQHRFAEHPAMPSIALKATITGKRIALVNPEASDPFPAGVLAEGELMWHTASKQWIIGHNTSDRVVRDVGGCSDGPEVVDLVGKIYWTC